MFIRNPERSHQDIVIQIFPLIQQNFPARKKNQIKHNNPTIYQK